MNSRLEKAEGAGFEDIAAGFKLDLDKMVNGPARENLLGMMASYDPHSLHQVLPSHLKDLSKKYFGSESEGAGQLLDRLVEDNPLALLGQSSVEIAQELINAGIKPETVAGSFLTAIRHSPTVVEEKVDQAINQDRNWYIEMRDDLFERHIGQFFGRLDELSGILQNRETIGEQILEASGKDNLFRTAVIHLDSIAKLVQPKDAVLFLRENSGLRNYYYNCLTRLPAIVQTIPLGTSGMTEWVTALCAEPSQQSTINSHLGEIVQATRNDEGLTDRIIGNHFSRMRPCSLIEYAEREGLDAIPGINEVNRQDIRQALIQAIESEPVIAQRARKELTLKDPGDDIKEALDKASKAEILTRLAQLKAKGLTALNEESIRKITGEFGAGTAEAIQACHDLAMADRPYYFLDKAVRYLPAAMGHNGKAFLELLATTFRRDNLTAWQDLLTNPMNSLNDAIDEIFSNNELQPISRMLNIFVKEAQQRRNGVERLDRYLQAMMGNPKVAQTLDSLQPYLGPGKTIEEEQLSVVKETAKAFVEESVNITAQENPFLALLYSDDLADFLGGPGSLPEGTVNSLTNYMRDEENAGLFSDSDIAARLAYAFPGGLPEEFQQRFLESVIPRLNSQLANLQHQTGDRNGYFMTLLDITATIRNLSYALGGPGCLPADRLGDFNLQSLLNMMVTADRVQMGAVSQIADLIYGLPESIKETIIPSIQAIPNLKAGDNRNEIDSQIKRYMERGDTFDQYPKSHIPGLTELVHPYLQKLQASLSEEK